MAINSSTAECLGVGFGFGFGFGLDSAGCGLVGAGEGSSARVPATSAGVPNRAPRVRGRPRDLMTQRQDLDVLCRIGTGEHRQPTQHASKQQVVRRPQRPIMLGVLWTVTVRSAPR